jgi:hypothetical protein
VPGQYRPTLSRDREKLIVVQLVSNFPVSYATRSFCILITAAHWTVPERDESIPSPHTKFKIHFNIIL